MPTTAIWRGIALRTLGRNPLSGVSSTAGDRTRSTATPAAAAHDKVLADRSVRKGSIEGLAVGRETGG